MHKKLTNNSFKDVRAFQAELVTSTLHVAQGLGSIRKEPKENNTELPCFLNSLDFRLDLKDYENTQKHWKAHITDLLNWSPETYTKMHWLNCQANGQASWMLFINIIKYYWPLEDVPGIYFDWISSNPWQLLNLTRRSWQLLYNSFGNY